MSNSKFRVVPISKGWVPQVMIKRLHWARVWWCPFRFQKEVEIWLGITELGITREDLWRQRRECCFKEKEAAEKAIEAYKAEQALQAATTEQREKDFSYLGEL